jgi:hypothetical protein
MTPETVEDNMVPPRSENRGFENSQKNFEIFWQPSYPESVKIGEYFPEFRVTRNKNSEKFAKLFRKFFIKIGRKKTTNLIQKSQNSFSRQQGCSVAFCSLAWLRPCFPFPCFPMTRFCVRVFFHPLLFPRGKLNDVEMWFCTGPRLSILAFTSTVKKVSANVRSRDKS